MWSLQQWAMSPNITASLDLSRRRVIPEAERHRWSITTLISPAVPFNTLYRTPIWVEMLYDDSGCEMMDEGVKTAEIPWGDQSSDTCLK